MTTPWVRALVAAAAWLWAVPVSSATPPTPPLTPASLVPCAFALTEVAEALGVQLKKAEAADMKLPTGRDVGCLYSVKGSDFVFGVRQTWDSTRPVAGAAARARRGFKPLAGDPDGARVKIDAPSSVSGELVYTRGKVETRVFWHGGSLGNVEGLGKLLLLRRVP